MSFSPESEAAVEWGALMDALKTGAHLDTYLELTRRYKEPHRAYHISDFYMKSQRAET